LGWPALPIDAFPDPTIILGNRDQIMFVNAQAETLFGYDRAELVGQPFRLLVPDQTNLRTADGLVRMHGRHKNGTEVSVEVLLGPLGEGSVIVARDVSARKLERFRDEAAGADKRARLMLDVEIHQLELEVQNRELRDAQNALEESRSRYVDLYDFAPIAYFTFDLRGCIREVNLTGATLIGRDRAQLIGAPFVSLVKLADPAQFWAHLRCAETRAPATTELALTVRNATTHLRAISSPVADPAGRILAFRTAFIDITDRYKAIRSRDNLLATVSHDLRSPLSAISISAKLLLRTLAPEEATAHKQAETISHAAERMSRFIDDLLTASTIESGRLTVTTRPERIEQIIGETIDAFTIIGAECSLQVDAKLAPGLPDVLCDRDRIHQILANLVGNATKFTPPGGRITIEVARHGDDVHVSVIDTGPGIPEDVQPHVFERYWTGGPNNRRGVGLGLYICKGIIDSHGGRIWVESTPGAGARFTFSIPVAESRRPD